jgi:hypothetical protein
MKIRNGFVSNSSSSSFVAFGIDISDDPKLKEKFVDEENYELSDEGEKLLPEGTEYGYYEGCGEILGWVLGSGSSDDGSFDCEEVELEELAEYAKAFEKATGLKPHLMGGTYAS